MPLRKDFGSLSKVYVINLSPRPFPRNIQPFIRVIVHWGNGNNYIFSGLLDIDNELKLIVSQNITVVHPSEQVIEVR